jgi:hypothetical protein
VRVSKREQKKIVAEVAAKYLPLPFQEGLTDDEKRALLDEAIDKATNEARWRIYIRHNELVDASFRKRMKRLQEESRERKPLDEWLKPPTKGRFRPVGGAHPPGAFIPRVHSRAHNGTTIEPRARSRRSRRPTGRRGHERRLPRRGGAVERQDALAGHALPPAPALKCDEWATRPLKSSSNAASLESESLLDTALDFEQVSNPSLRQLDRLGSIAGARA